MFYFSFAYTHKGITITMSMLVLQHRWEQFFFLMKINTNYIILAKLSQFDPKYCSVW